jgi:hypothetical protein
LPITTVLLADLPRMLEDMVSSVLEAQPNIRVVRGEARDCDLVSAAAACGAHAVVVTRGDPANLAEVDRHLARAASVSIIALAADGAWACLYTLKPDVTRLEDLSTAKVLAALAAATPIGHV